MGLCDRCRNFFTEKSDDSHVLYVDDKGNRRRYCISCWNEIRLNPRLLDETPEVYHARKQKTSVQEAAMRHDIENRYWGTE